MPTNDESVKGVLPLFSGIPRRRFLGNWGWFYPLSKERWYGDLESYPQQMEHQDDQPPNHTADSADKYGKEVDRNRRRNSQVCQKQEYQANDGVNGQPHQQRGCSREQGEHREQCYANYYDEHDPFHGEPLYLNSLR